MDYKQASDMELWQCCRQDDLRAYNELFARFYPRMLHLASRYFNDTMKAEELCMDQLFSLWTKRHQLNITGNFSHYLFRSIRNLVIDHLRKNLPVETSLDELEEVHPMEGSADSRLLTEEVSQAYHKALDKLSPQRREAFVLSREENLTYSEIAQRMNLSVNTVENYMAAALGCIRRNMKEYAPSSVILLLCLSDFPLHLL
ncbi:RNA polymerase sigma factor [Sphingobacterium hotanense]|uniref:RNA polymerase sigma factor n=1 Tax=Sphingobacterium hotanense TaxID=649196 RepID=UPI0021A68341|nr:RNA polymerase sigma-70 factor [Sphingobacterium hotanense]MCT1523860.1 RNA polymerase sigma-70 factor [Sphingobacterium hotanense]